MTRRLAWIPFVLLVACGGTEPGPAGPGGAKGDNPLCRPDPDPGTLCSVTEVACQQRIWHALACVHPQAAGELAPISFAADPGQPDGTAASAGGYVYRSAADLTLRALGVGTRDVTAAGRFDPDTDSVLLSDAAAAGELGDYETMMWVFTLAHELVHAIQYQWSRIYFAEDARVGQSVVEGEANYYALLTLRQMGIDVDIEATLAGQEAALLEIAKLDFGVATGLFPYYIGQRLIHETRQRYGDQAVFDLSWSDNQPTTYELLYRAAMPTAPSLRCEPAVANDDNDPTSYTQPVSLDAWHVVGLLQSVGVGDPVTLGRTWRGGQAFLRQSVSGEDWSVTTETARWRLRWSDAATAQQVAGLIDQAWQNDPRRTVTYDGTDVVVSGTTGEPAWAPDPLPLRCEP